MILRAAVNVFAQFSGVIVCFLLGSCKVVSNQARIFEHVAKLDPLDLFDGTKGLAKAYLEKKCQGLFHHWI